MAIRLADAAATEAFGAALAALASRRATSSPCSAALGAGKTTLARGVLRGLGHAGDVASPTFPIVQAYEPPDTRIPVWHVDLYRIEDPAELEEIGLDDALAEAALLIEWPERLPALWPDALRLTLGDPGGRRPRLDSLGAARLGGAMAAPMIPPGGGAGFSCRAWLGGLRDQAAGRRRQLPPLFPRRRRATGARC